MFAQQTLSHPSLLWDRPTLKPTELPLSLTPSSHHSLVHNASGAQTFLVFTEQHFEVVFMSTWKVLPQGPLTETQTPFLGVSSQLLVRFFLLLNTSYFSLANISSSVIHNIFST